MGRTFYYAVAEIIRERNADPECDEPTRESCAAFARKVADKFRRGDPTFRDEWFFGACGLDHWGDLLPPRVATGGRPVRWDPRINDFRID